MAGEVLRIVGGEAAGSEIQLRGEVVLGRNEGPLRFDDQVSRRHARVTLSDGAVLIEDLGSVNGTYVNGERIQGRVPLSNGDRVDVGDTTLELLGAAAGGRTQLKPRNEFGERLRAVGGPALGREWVITDELVLGREVGKESIAEDAGLSRRHARIVRMGDGALVIEDLGSMNGTFLNGWRFPTPQRLSPGDKVDLGDTTLELAGDVTVARRASIVGTIAGAARPSADASEALFYAEGVMKSYGELEVLKGVDLEVQPGEVLGLLGPNGAGKSTFVSIVAGLLQADSGAVRINGVDALHDAVDARAHLGIAPQELGIYPTMSVRRNLLFAGEISGLSGRLLTERVEEIADALSLTPLLDRISDRMSGGQKRRLHTGMAMLHHPALLILDEPTVGADIRTRQEILDVVKKLASEGRAVIYSTHYMPEIQELGASVGVLDDGRIIARGSIAELVAKHSSAAVELVFDGPAPELEVGDRLRDRMTTAGSMLRITAPDPAEAAASVLPMLGHHARRLLRVDVVQPSLDAVYLSLTERRYESSTTDREALPPPVAIPAGYYPDPLSEGQRRYWDGVRWTDQVAA